MLTKTPVQSPLRGIAQALLLALVTLSFVLTGCGGDSKDKNPVPVLTSVSPASAMAGEGDFTLTVSGSAFVSKSSVQWNGAARSTEFVSSSQLRAAISAADIASAGTAQVTVFSPSPGGGTSAAVSFSISNPGPTVSSLAPATVIAGSAAFDLTVNGGGFVAGSIVEWDGDPRTTVFVSTSQVRASIAATDVEAAGTVQVRVVNATPGGGVSTELTFTIQNPVPSVASLNPAEVLEGTNGLQLEVTGAGFLEGAIVTWDGAYRSTEYAGATRLIASIPGADLVGARTVSVRVRNPEPTAGPSESLTFIVAALPAPPPSGFPALITQGLDGSFANGPSVNGGMTLDANHAVFASKASNLVTADNNGTYDLFVRDTCVSTYAPSPTECAPATMRVVLGLGGAEPNGDIGWTTTSPEDSLAVSFYGRFAAFVSSASNLVADDTNGVDDVFLVDLCLDARTACIPGVIRVSLGNDGSQTTAPSSYPAVSDDGRYVVFVSADPGLVPGDTNGVADVFLRDTCRGGEAGCVPSTTRISVASSGAQANAPSGEPVFTGRYVAFSSLASNLVASDPNGVQDVFVRDTCIGAIGCAPSTRLVSVGRLGDPADGPSSDPQVGPPMMSMANYDYHGRFVAFVSSATNLVAGDANGASDVFLRDLCLGRSDCTPSTARVSLTHSGAEIQGDSWSPGYLRWDGESIAFVTAADGVVIGDTNGVSDVYLRHDCPLGAPDYCVPTTRRVSLGADGFSTDGDSYAPRMAHDLFGAWVGTFISEASNILPESAVVPDHGNIYMDVAH
jgi:trimeric autotransporter adhesin